MKARAGAARRRATMLHFMVVCSGRTGLACLRRRGRKKEGIESENWQTALTFEWATLH
jgi:hypothetical protein